MTEIEFILLLISFGLFITWYIIFTIKRKKANRMDKLRFDALHENLETYDLIKSGYAGTLSNGNIVDRRLYPNAFVLPENKYMGIPKPKKL